jgi:thioredoxin 1
MHNMRIKNFVGVLLLAISMVSCNGQNKGVKDIGAAEFEKGLQQPGAQLVDVRTPEEYNEKHLKGATHININDKDFEKRLGELDKSKPVYIYCLSGGRSSRAANLAVKTGFKEVYNLEGGITSWIGTGKPVETATGGKPAMGMSFDDYLNHIKAHKLVLVDFNATWCGPCKILKPIVHKVVKKNEGKVDLFDIDVDKNPDVANTMKVSGIPLILLYKDGKEVWRQMGLTDEDTLNAKIQAFSSK